ncbi:MAG: RNA polymerase sigma factor [Acidobacteria bacterium]|nr:RNA polymerase sigma factor [Acidobacteriota bacterium]
MTPYTDEELMAELVRGETGALDELYRRYARPLYVFCDRLIQLRGTRQAEDLVQDIFLRVIRGAAGFDSRRASFRTWLFRIARHGCIDVLRQRGKVKIVPLEEEKARSDDPYLRPQAVENPAGSNIQAETDATQMLVHTEWRQAIRDCIAALPNYEEREAVILYYLGGKVLVEIGRILGKSTSTAKNRVWAARAKLKACLAGKGVSP